MKTELTFFVAVGLIAISCGSKHQSQTDEISGTYVREYSFKVIHPERGDTIGFRTVRDTIFISQKDRGYEVSNNKWSSNDYDKEGWQNMEHLEDRPLSTYQANFNIVDSSLRGNEFTPTLYLNPNPKQLFKTKKPVNPYAKIK